MSSVVLTKVARSLWRYLQAGRYQGYQQGCERRCVSSSAYGVLDRSLTATYSVRQMTNWGSRMGFARLAEQGIRKARGKGEKDSLGALDKIAASTVGGALGTWNQPIEVVRVEMQSMAKQTSANRPAKLTVFK